MIATSWPWGFFEGVKQGPWEFGSVGGILYYLDNHFVKFKAGLGSSTNNWMELMTLRCLLKLENMKRFDQLYVYGDCLLVLY